ncbi:sugar phosphate isomerase/epimerase [Aneurinibacillus sp. Ricciae_BoGa-3]|uniref:sugar phosphate isomerase/epimerase family protein n=1 Tax=Aneurinibacillus sp. Ricciae_BoGa-3 TaxID=3022697 RepID=UPI0023422A38|nr:sugar phosphate isomerase/epimerase [Aneurinibacillus sp. Ricciae_BoGa-3]WCK54713.1 sugar phosphate isomerase/epimerase [Aneurinibacillus sp. Ricciae_BoGa-3]
MKGISFNTWVYGSFPTWVPSYTLDNVIVRLSDMGYDALEIGCASPHAWPAYLSAQRRREISQLLQSKSLKVSSMLPAPGGGPGMNPASPLEEERKYTVEHYKDVIRLAHDLECPTVLYIAGWIVHGTTQQQAKEYSRAGLQEMADYAKDLSVTIVIEPTSADSNLIESADDAIELLQATGRQNVKLMFDTFHVMYRNEVPVDYVDKMKDNLAHIHIADSDRMPPGQGRCDYKGLIQALKRIGYDGYLTMEIGFDKRSADPDWYARTSLEYLRELWK